MSKLIRQAKVDDQTRRLSLDDSDRPAIEQYAPFDSEKESTLQGKKDTRFNDDQSVAQQKIDQERVEQEARERGYLAGYEQGKNEAKQQLYENITQATEIIASLNASTEDYLNDVKRQMTAVVHEAVLKIIGQNLESVAEKTINEVIERTSSERLVAICLNQRDYERLSKSTEFTQLHNYLKPDSRVKFGGCIIETQAGGIDARVETQLDEFTNLLIEHIDNQSD